MDGVALLLASCLAEYLVRPRHPEWRFFASRVDAEILPPSDQTTVTIIVTLTRLLSTSWWGTVGTVEDGTEARARHAVVVGVWTVIGLLAVLGGLAGIVTSIAGSSAAQVPVEVTTPAEFGGVKPCAGTDELLDAGACEPPPGWRADLLMISMPPDGLTLDTFDAPWLTRVLAWAPVWLGLLTGGTAVLVLVPVVRNIARGAPFADSATARLWSAAGVVAVGWAAATLGWFLAARREVDRLEGLGLPAGLGEGWVAADLRTVSWPMIVVGMLATLAAASRRGAALTAETEGLV